METVTFSTKLDPAVPKSKRQVVQLTPGRGAVRARDGRTFVLSDLGQIIQASERYAGSTDLVVDFDHQTDRSSQNGQLAPAAGWIKKFEVRKDGIWAHVEWTDRAAEMIAAKEYRYLSPAMSLDKDSGRVCFIARAALVNSPALEMAALAAAETGETTMDDLKPLRDLLGLEETATIDDVLAAVTKLRAAAGGNTAVEGMATELARERQKLSVERCEAKVERAIARGAFPPSLRTFCVDMARADEERFDAFVEKIGTPLGYLMKPAVDDKEFEEFRSRNTVDQTATTADVARNLGISADAMKD